MKKYILIFLLLFSASAGFCGDLGETFLNSLGLQVYFSHATPLPVIATITANVSIPATQTGIISNTASWSTGLSSGILGTFSLSIPLETAVALPTAPAGAKSVILMPTQDVNWGDSTVASGTNPPYLFQSVPGQGFFGFSLFTSFRLIGRTAIATASGRWY